MCRGIRDFEKGVKESEQQSRNSPQIAASFVVPLHPIPRQRPVIRLQAKLKKTQVWSPRVALPVDGGIRRDGSAQSIFGSSRIGTGAEGWGRVSRSLLSARPAV